jgi:hypothetical protein
MGPVLPRLRSSALLPWLIAVAVAFVPVATCLIAAAPSERMACHDGMEQHQEASLDEPCCPGDSAASPISSSAGQFTPSISAPTAVLIAVMPAIEPWIPAGTRTTEPPGTRKPPGPPMYVLVSSFRI